MPVRRKLASLELKVIIVLITWKFELQRPPPALSSFMGKDVLTNKPQSLKASDNVFPTDGGLMSSEQS